MKKFYTKRFSLICAFAASALLLGGGCSEDETEPAIGSKGVSSEVFVSSDAGSRTIKVETSGPWQARLTPETRLWVSVDGADSGETGGSLNLNYRTNNSLPRKGTILVSSARQQVVDTIYLMQYGTTPLLEFKYIGKQYSSVSTIDSVAIDTNIPLSKKIYWTVVYDENSAAEPWADSVSYAQDFKYFRFRIADNKKFEPRAARFRLRFRDDWGEDHTTYFTAYQGIPGGTAETREMTFEELRGLIAEAEGEITLDQDIAVSGTVISDWASPNMAGSPMPKAAEKPDLGINDCTAYMQNADASLGLALVTTDAQQNNLQRYDKLKLWCKGLTLTKRSNPERYTLSGVTQDHIVTKEAGTAEELPAKRRFIDQLTDADIYTQVTLKRCQMAVRTGRFIPVHINYTNSFNNYYPAAVLDRHGDMIYLMTNHGCDWRFKEMPDGEGTITGIIVHEPYTFFERGGDIGRYQIRNVTREDIALDESADNVFSAVAVEWSPDGSKDPRAYAFPQYPHPATDSGQAHCVAATTGSGLSFMSTYAWLAVGSAYRKRADHQQRLVGPQTAVGHGEEHGELPDLRVLDAGRQLHAMLLRLHLPLPLGTGRTALLDGGIFARRRQLEEAHRFHGSRQRQLGQHATRAAFGRQERVDAGSHRDSGTERGMDPPAPRAEQDRHGDDLRHRDHRIQRTGSQRIHRLLRSPALQQINQRTT